MLPTWLSISDCNLEVLSLAKKCDQLISHITLILALCVSKALHKAGFIPLLKFFRKSNAFTCYMFFNIFVIFFLATQVFFSLLDTTGVLLKYTQADFKLTLSYATVKLCFHIQSPSQINLQVFFWNTDYNSVRLQKSSKLWNEDTFFSNACFFTLSGFIRSVKKLTATAPLEMCSQPWLQMTPDRQEPSAESWPSRLHS